MSGELSEQMVRSLAIKRGKQERRLEAVLGLAHNSFKGRLWNTCFSTKSLPGSWTLISVLSSPFQAWNPAYLLMLLQWAHAVPYISWFPNLHLHARSPDFQGRTNYVLTRCSCLGVPQALPVQHVQNYLHLLPSIPKINLPFIHAPWPYHWPQDSLRCPVLKPESLSGYM